jgi:hypothetical protein
MQGPINIKKKPILQEILCLLVYSEENDTGSYPQQVKPSSRCSCDSHFYIIHRFTTGSPSRLKTYRVNDDCLHVPPLQVFPVLYFANTILPRFITVMSDDPVVSH